MGGETRVYRWLHAFGAVKEFHFISTKPTRQIARHFLVRTTLWMPLFYFVLFEQNAFSNNRIIFDKCDFVLRIGNILSRRVEKSRPRRREQLDGNRLALAPGHHRYCGMNHSC